LRRGSHQHLARPGEVSRQPATLAGSDPRAATIRLAAAQSSTPELTLDACDSDACRVPRIRDLPGL
jgi:hypothetical protein